MSAETSARRSAAWCRVVIPAASGRVVAEEGEDLPAIETLPTSEEGELDHERACGHLAAAALDELDRRRGGAAGGEQIVDQRKRL